MTRDRDGVATARRAVNDAMKGSAKTIQSTWGDIMIGARRELGVEHYFAAKKKDSPWQSGATQRVRGQCQKKLRRRLFPSGAFGPQRRSRRAATAAVALVFRIIPTGASKRKRRS